MIINNKKDITINSLFGLASDIVYSNFLVKKWDNKIIALAHKLEVANDKKEIKSLDAKMAFANKEIDAQEKISRKKIVELYSALDYAVKKQTFVDVYEDLVALAEDIVSRKAELEAKELVFGDEANSRDEVVTKFDQAEKAWSLLADVAMAYGVKNAYVLPDYGDEENLMRGKSKQEIASYREKRNEEFEENFGLVSAEALTSFGIARFNYIAKDRKKILEAGKAGKKVRTLEADAYSDDMEL